MYDIKSMDSAIHKIYTGVDNTLILANLEWLVGSGTKFIVRLPLIPGVNDSSTQMEAVLEAIRDAKDLVRVEMLRYHKTAGAKYAMLGMEYNPPFDVHAPVEINNVFKKNNIKNIIL
jgi:pyruvate formate lyase activating enzyme